MLSVGDTNIQNYWRVSKSEVINTHPPQIQRDLAYLVLNAKPVHYPQFNDGQITSLDVDL